MKRQFLALSSTCVLVAAGAAAQTKATDPRAPSAEQVNAIYPDVEALYLDLHRNPELSLQEQQTAAKLAEHMRALGYEVTTGVGGTGVLAVLNNGQGPTVLLRTDMDALPIEEKCRRLSQSFWLSRAGLVDQIVGWTLLMKASASSWMQWQGFPFSKRAIPRRGFI